MIRPININLNAAHPELPLVEATTFVGAPSSVFIRGVPKAVGNWSITAVSVAVTYPDNTTTARAAVESAEGVWVATIPGTATSGRTAAGFKIVADGIDENGAAVTGYVLGFADFSVLSFTPVPAPGGTFYFLRYFDQAPATPKEGDVAKIDGVLKFYNGSAWETFAASVTLDNAVTRTSANGVKSSGIWSMIWGALTEALPTGFTSLYDWCAAQLAGKASTADATLTVIANAWEYIIYDPVPRQPELGLFPKSETSFGWAPMAGGVPIGSTKGDIFSTVLTWEANEWDGGFKFTAVRSGVKKGYVLGSQMYMPLASEAEAEALRTGKQDALSAQQLANIAAVPNKLDKSGGEMTGSLSAPQVNITRDGYPTWSMELDSEVGRFHFKAPPLAGVLGSVDLALPRRTDNISGTVALAASPSTAGNLAALDASGNPTDAGWTAGDLARYALTTKTISNNAVTLDDRAINAVAVSSSLASLTVNFPTATSGKVRDFAMRLNIAAGVTAPEIAWPQGVTLENDGGEVPEIADGGTGGSSTILYFSETENNGTTAKFLVKGEALAAITQA